MIKPRSSKFNAAIGNKRLKVYCEWVVFDGENWEFIVEFHIENSQIIQSHYTKYDVKILLELLEEFNQLAEKGKKEMHIPIKNEKNNQLLNVANRINQDRNNLYPNHSAKDSYFGI